MRQKAEKKFSDTSEKVREEVKGEVQQQENPLQLSVVAPKVPATPQVDSSLYRNPLQKASKALDQLGVSRTGTQVQYGTIYQTLPSAFSQAPFQQWYRVSSGVQIKDLPFQVNMMGNAIGSHYQRPQFNVSFDVQQYKRQLEAKKKQLEGLDEQIQLPDPESLVQKPDLPQLPSLDALEFKGQLQELGFEVPQLPGSAEDSLRARLLALKAQGKDLAMDSLNRWKELGLDSALLAKVPKDSLEKWWEQLEGLELSAPDSLLLVQWGDSLLPIDTAGLAQQVREKRKLAEQLAQKYQQVKVQVDSLRQTARSVWAYLKNPDSLLADIQQFEIGTSYLYSSPSTFDYTPIQGANLVYQRKHHGVQLAGGGYWDPFAIREAWQQPQTAGKAFLGAYSYESDRLMVKPFLIRVQDSTSHDHYLGLSGSWNFTKNSRADWELVQRLKPDGSLEGTRALQSELSHLFPKLHHEVSVSAHQVQEDYSFAPNPFLQPHSLTYRVEFKQRLFKETLQLRAYLEQFTKKAPAEAGDEFHFSRNSIGAEVKFEKQTWPTLSVGYYPIANEVRFTPQDGEAGFLAVDTSWATAIKADVWRANATYFNRMRGITWLTNLSAIQTTVIAASASGVNEKIRFLTWYNRLSFSPQSSVTGLYQFISMTGREKGMVELSGEKQLAKWLVMSAGGTLEHEGADIISYGGLGSIELRLKSLPTLSVRWKSLHMEQPPLYQVDDGTGSTTGWQHWMTAVASFGF